MLVRSPIASLFALLCAFVSRAVNATPSNTEGPPIEEPIVDVGYTAFLGNASLPGVHFFGGIRFAQPPLGELRWRPPAELDETPKQNKTLTDAQWFGNICLQQPAELGFGSDGEQTEPSFIHTFDFESPDCLTLNVWKPAQAKAGDNLPVALYIHGGGNYYAVCNQRTLGLTQA